MSPCFYAINQHGATTQFVRFSRYRLRRKLGVDV